MNSTKQSFTSMYDPLKTSPFQDCHRKFSSNQIQGSHLYDQKNYEQGNLSVCDSKEIVNDHFFVVAVQSQLLAHRQMECTWPSIQVQLF